MSIGQLIIEIILNDHHIVDESGIPPYEYNYDLNEYEKVLLSRIFNLALPIYYQHYDKISTFQKKITNIKEENLEPLMTSLYEQLTANSKSWYGVLLFFNIIAEFHPLYIGQDYLIDILSEVAMEKIEPWVKKQNGWDSVHIYELVTDFPEIDVTIAFSRRSKRLAHKRWLRNQELLYPLLV